MKKIAAILLALLVCLGVALAEETDFTGTWYATEIVMGEMNISVASLGMDMSLTLQADGTGVSASGGESAECTWVMENGSAVVTSDGESMAFTLVDGKLVTEQEGAYLYFEREKAEVETYVPAEAKADAAMADYNGVWDAVIAEMLGMQMSVEAMGMSMQVVVNDGAVMLVEGVGEEATYAETTAVVEDGALVLQGEDGNVALQLLQDGVMVMSQDMGEGLVVSIYFEKLIADIQE